jgi:hypothetical protein
MKIQGSFLYYDVENLNGRIYTKECAENIVRQVQELADSGETLLGQIGYPNGDDYRGKLGEISHEVKEIHINPETHAVDGTIEILDTTPNGKRLLEMIDHDMKKFNESFAIRPRGIGEINKNKEVVNYEIVSFDIIHKKDDAFLDEHPLKLE